MTVGNNAPVNAILKDVQYHPVTDKILHIDFQELVPNRAVKVSVPVEFVGSAQGIQDGGTLVPVLRKLKINFRFGIRIFYQDKGLGTYGRYRDTSQ